MTDGVLAAYREAIVKFQSVSKFTGRLSFLETFSLNRSADCRRVDRRVGRVERSMMNLDAREHDSATAAAGAASARARSRASSRRSPCMVAAQPIIDGLFADRARRLRAHRRVRADRADRRRGLLRLRVSAIRRPSTSITSAPRSASRRSRSSPSRPPTSTTSRRSAARSTSCARLTVAWSIVFLVAASPSMFFARLGDHVFARLARRLLRHRPARRSMASAWCSYGMVRRWSREGRLDRRAVRGRRRRARRDAGRPRSAQQADSDVRLVGVFDDRGDERAPNFCGGLPKLGTVDDLVEFARRTRVDLVLFSLPISAESRILQMLKKLWVLPVDIRLSAHTNKLRFRPRSYSYIGSRAGARRVRPADRRLGRRDEMAVRQGRRRPRAARALARDGARPRSPSSSTAAARCCSSRSATASTTS